MDAFYMSAFTLVMFLVFFFFFNDTATTEIYTLSLHDALPISTAWSKAMAWPSDDGWLRRRAGTSWCTPPSAPRRSRAVSPLTARHSGAWTLQAREANATA